MPLKRRNFICLMLEVMANTLVFVWWRYLKNLWLSTIFFYGAASFDWVYLHCRKNKYNNMRFFLNWVLLASIISKQCDSNLVLVYGQVPVQKAHHNGLRKFSKWPYLLHNLLESFAVRLHFQDDFTFYAMSMSYKVQWTWKYTLTYCEFWRTCWHGARRCWRASNHQAWEAF